MITLHEMEEPTWVESCKAEIEEILSRYPEDVKSGIMPLLHLAQRERGHVALADMQAIADIMDVTVAYVDSVCSFYAMYHRRPVGKYVLTVCGALMCHHLANGKNLVEQMEQVLGVKAGETTPDGLITLEVTPECLAACDLAPVAQCNVEYLVNLTPAKAEQVIKAIRAGEGPDAFIEKLPLMNGETQSEWKGFEAVTPQAEPAPAAEAAPEETPEPAAEAADETEA